MGGTTVESDLTSLLDKWAELEPEECGAEDQYYWVDYQGEHRTVREIGIRKDWYWISKPHIQAAVQEAIEERGWEMRTSYIPENGWDAQVAAVDMTWRLARGSSPTHALLAAYLKALRNHAS